MINLHNLNGTNVNPKTYLHLPAFGAFPFDCLLGRKKKL